MQHLLFAKPCLLFYVHFTRFCLPLYSRSSSFSPCLFTLLPSSSPSCCCCRCFIIYVSLCRAWLARTYVNSKRPVSISWQASLYTVCPEKAPPLPSRAPSTTPLSTLDLAMRFLYVLMPSSTPKVPLSLCQRGGKGGRMNLCASKWIRGFVRICHAAHPVPHPAQEMQHTQEWVVC